MIWFTWRQFRTQTWITIGILATLGVLLVITGLSLADAYEANVANCGSNCAGGIESFLREASTGANGNVYGAATAAVFLVPALIGLFWGAPLIARELETGTHRLAWNQSVTRLRWLATKLAVIAAATAATVGLLSWAVTAWARRIDQLGGDRIAADVYGARGIVPVGYALFALTLGVTAGMLIRRTVPAMGATLAGYAAAAVAMTLWIREWLVPTSHAIRPLDMSTLEGVSLRFDGEMEVIGGGLPEGAWVLSNRTIGTDGQVFTGPWDPAYCGPEAPASQCDEWIGSLGLRQEITYHPAGQFWPLQWAETGCLLAAAILLAGFSFWWLRRRVS
jgi:ABC-2 family transporter